MEFRAPSAAAQKNEQALLYLTEHITDKEAAISLANEIMSNLGNAVDKYPDWHPILTAPLSDKSEHIYSLSQISAYEGLDHTVEFVRGFITCPYTPEAADQLVDRINQISGLSAYLTSGPLYANKTYPVVVEANCVRLEADGTIRSRDALTWFVQQSAAAAENALVAETWWNMRANLLGSPHGSRSSLFVNQHTGLHIRKILETLNASGMFGPIKESSLDMLSKAKRNSICETVLRAALNSWDESNSNFKFELRDEICEAHIRDTWDDKSEIFIRVKIGNYDLSVSGFFYPSKNKMTYTEPTGKKSIAEKFI